MKTYSFEEVENAGISDWAKEIIQLGKEANTSDNFDYDKLASTIVDFEFIVPVTEQGDMLNFPTIVLNSEMEKDLFIPIFTCYGEMYKTLHKLNILNDYNRLMTIKMADMVNFIENLDYEGFIIDAHSISVITKKQ